jgi:hypothetical protein
VQASDGQSVFLHPLSMKCLLQHYGSYEALPPSLEASLVEAESVTMATEGTRKKYRYLAHLSLTGAFMLCEVRTTGKRLAAESLSSVQPRRRKADSGVCYIFSEEM